MRKAILWLVLFAIVAAVAYNAINSASGSHKALSVTGFFTKASSDVTVLANQVFDEAVKFLGSIFKKAAISALESK